jgi:alkylhydroperoxidase family enzyme
MNEARIPLLPPDEARHAAGEAGIPEYMAELSVFRILLHQPGVAAALNGMLHALLFKGRLDARLRELIIMRIGWSTGSLYEWTQHWRVATQLGMTAEDICAVRDWQNHGYGPAERAVLAATDETLGSGTISAATFETCREHVGGDDVLVEMVAAIGNWRLFSQLLRSLEVPLEEGVEPWPPDGLVPPAAGGET